MIALTGIDIVEIERVRRMAEKFGDRFQARLYTPTEQAYCNGRPKPELHFAARFCAKEAVSKALKTGLSGGIRWTDIEIVNDPTSGAPSVILHEKALERFRSMHGISLEVSLSHSDTVAAASAVLLTGNG